MISFCKFLYETPLAHIKDKKMKKLILILCIAMSGQAYGQLDGLNRGITESLSKEEQLFTSEGASFQEYFLNINDYTRE